MAFYPNSEITIGGLRFSGVHGCTIKRSLHSYSDTATLIIPSEGRIKRKNGLADEGMVTTGTIFSEGDAVTIRLGYNGRMHEEFSGFVQRLNPGEMLTVECEGYSRQLRLNNNISGFLKVTNAAELLKIAVGQIDAKRKPIKKPLTDITVRCMVDMPMHNITMDAATGTAIVDEIIKVSQGTLAIFFIEPKVLWCGMVYTPYRNNSDPFGTGAVNYRLGYNCQYDNALKERVVSEPVQVVLDGRLATGHTVQTASEAKHYKNKVKGISNNIQSTAMLQQMANEKQYRLNYNGYEGNLTGFLEPYCQPGHVANIVDRRYPKRGGKYMVESIEVRYGVRGAWRVVEIGPKLGFNPDKIQK